MSGKNKTIAENIKFLRKWNKITQLELGKRCGLSDSSISDIEKCRQTTSIDHYIEIIAAALEVPSDALTEDNQSVNNKFDLLKNVIQSGNITEDVIATSDELVEITKNRGGNEKFRALYYRGDIAFKSLHYKDALDYFGQLAPIATITKDATHMHMSRFNMARVHLQLGNFESAKELLEKDLSDQRSMANRIHKAKNLQALGLLYKRKMMLSEAENFFLRAIEEMQHCAEGNTKFFAKTHQLLGDLYRDLALFESAIEVSMTALSLAEQVNDYPTIIYSKRTISLVYLDSNQENEALNHFLHLKELGYSLKINYSEQLKNMFYLAFCQRNLDEMIDALNQLKNYEVPKRELAKMYERAGNVATEKKSIELTHMLYQECFTLLYN